MESYYTENTQQMICKYFAPGNIGILYLCVAQGSGLLSSGNRQTKQRLTISRINSAQNGEIFTGGF